MHPSVYRTVATCRVCEKPIIDHHHLSDASAVRRHDRGACAGPYVRQWGHTRGEASANREAAAMLKRAAPFDEDDDEPAAKRVPVDFAAMPEAPAPVTDAPTPVDHTVDLAVWSPARGSPCSYRVRVGTSEGPVYVHVTYTAEYTGVGPTYAHPQAEWYGGCVVVDAITTPTDAASPEESMVPVLQALQTFAAAEGQGVVINNVRSPGWAWSLQVKDPHRTDLGQDLTDDPENTNRTTSIAAYVPRDLFGTSMMYVDLSILLAGELMTDSDRPGRGAVVLQSSTPVPSFASDGPGLAIDERRLRFPPRPIPPIELPTQDVAREWFGSGTTHGGMRPAFAGGSFPHPRVVDGAPVPDPLNFVLDKTPRGRGSIVQFGPDPVGAGDVRPAMAGYMNIQYANYMHNNRYKMTYITADATGAAPPAVVPPMWVYHTIDVHQWAKHVLPWAEEVEPSPAQYMDELDAQAESDRQTAGDRLVKEAEKAGSYLYGQDAFTLRMLRSNNSTLTMHYPEHMAWCYGQDMSEAGEDGWALLDATAQNRPTGGDFSKLVAELSDANVPHITLRLKYVI
jgi:hypothetical protein